MKNSYFDAYAIGICEKNPNMLVPWYIMAAYAYYVQDQPIISDSLFDSMAVQILEKWETITHWHKEYLTQDMLKSGTYLGDYPTITETAIQALHEQST